MPLICHRKLAAWSRLQEEGIPVRTPAEVNTSNSLEIHIGFLNMMPERAVMATERQFLRLLAAAPDELHIFVHPFTLDGLERGGDTLEYVNQFYDSFADHQKIKTDGLVLTGANPGENLLSDEKFWPEFEEVIHWAENTVPTIMCSCLATHAVLNVFKGVERMRCIPEKRWGVFSHTVVASAHPLTKDFEVTFDAPRSHVFEMTEKQLNACGVNILATSAEADFHIATSADGFKWVFLQGHPEYDTVSLLKEYKREINRYLIKERDDYPDFPFNYFSQSAKDRLFQYKEHLLRVVDDEKKWPIFPEKEILPEIQNTWKEPGQVLFRNWLQSIADTK